MPALLCRTSTWPSCANTLSASASTALGSETSSAWATALPPAASIARATSSAVPPLRSATWTLAPCRASRSAVARPMPEPPPVTTATLPCRLGSLLTASSISSDELGISRFARRSPSPRLTALASSCLNLSLIAGVSQRAEQLTGREHLDAGVGEVLVLGPNGQAQLQRKRDGGPVVGVACGYALLSLLATILILT